ncbi:hypothetical protein PIB30_012361 [Stylosanthes scabra]|uniref:TraB family protein n=1 Tax=Stylosanthes scabra TaxID=79078 RepID=A0ABU6Z3S1_9FABA|nr:hypothetical protein [Stylosanthes scabra]
MAKGTLSEAKKSKSVVAVVGNAHLEGIKKHLLHKEQLNDLSVDDLLTIPPPNHNANILITSIMLVPSGVAMALVGMAIWKRFK